MQFLPCTNPRITLSFLTIHSLEALKSIYYFVVLWELISKFQNNFTELSTSIGSSFKKAAEWVTVNTDFEKQDYDW